MRELIPKLFAAVFLDNFLMFPSAEIEENQGSFQDRARGDIKKALKNNPNNFTVGSRGLILLFFILSALDCQANPINVDIGAEAAILINADTGQILFEKNARKKFYPASITKIATATYALKMHENSLDQIVTAHEDCVVSVSEEAKKKAKYTLPPHWLEKDGMHIGIKKGEELTLRDLLHGMMVASGNDAANVIAKEVAGSIPTFMKNLNAFLLEIGCKDTTFYNPHGLHHPEHQSTALDMAILTREALKNPIFRQVVSTVRYQRPQTNKQQACTLLQTNRLLRKGEHYNPKAFGVKTGYVSSASHTFVGAAEHQGRTLIAVILKSKDRDGMFRDCNNLFESAFTEKKIKKIFLKKGIQPYQLTLKNGSQTVQTNTHEDLQLEFYSSEKPNVKCFIYFEKDLEVPIEKNQKVGTVGLYSQDGTLIESTDLFAAEKITPKLLFKLKQTNFKPIALSIFFLLAILLLFQRKK